MKLEYVIGLSILSCIIGMIMFALFQGWIIIRYPCGANLHDKLTLIPTVSKKKVKLSFWNNDTWNNEETELIWSDDKADNIRYLINNLLNLMYEEDASSKKISLETVMISPAGQEAFLSFDRNPLRKEAPTYEKWMIIESILKTIQNNEIAIQSIRFLVHHKPLNDYHLDFSKAWAINCVA